MLAIATIAPSAFIAPVTNSMRASITMQAGGTYGADFAKALPGSGPFGFFDPLGCTTEESSQQIMLYREAELAHGRVAMMAAVGFLAQEAFHPMFPEVGGVAARQLDQVLSTEMGQLGGSILLMAIFFSEIYRANVGWVEPDVEMRTLREGYLPGDLGFDPLNLKPKTEKDFLTMQNKELNNGRLAMIAVAGMCAQEVASSAPIIGA